MKRDHMRSWSPVGSVPLILYCEDLHDDYESLQILLKGEDPASRIIRIRFDSVVAYRNINESYRMRTWSDVERPKTPLLLVDNSSWISWLKEEAAGVLDDVALTHYAIFTPEDCIDVVSAFSPAVEWIGGHSI